jgi:hypothetical protein
VIVLVIGITATLGLVALGLGVFVLDTSPPLRPAATRSQAGREGVRSREGAAREEGGKRMGRIGSFTPYPLT